MLKWCKMIVAFLLLPACFAAASTLWLVVRASGSADTIWAATVAGAACWLAIYLLLPKPMWVYVFGHELTHALWTWALGGKVKKFKAAASGGHVVVTRSNFLIALALLLPQRRREIALTGGAVIAALLVFGLAGPIAARLGDQQGASPWQLGNPRAR